MRTGCASSAASRSRCTVATTSTRALIVERCAELVAIEARASEIEALLQGARGLRRRGAAICVCGAPILMGARFCPSCGRNLIDESAAVEAEV